MGARSSKIYRCGDVEILPARGLVQVQGTAEHLRPKSLELLEYLICHRNRLVAKNELLDQLWKDTAVNEHAPAQCVIELRKALGDDARNPRFIKTVSKLGYQFIGAIEETVEPETRSVELEEVLTTQVEIEEGTRYGRLIAAGIALALSAGFLVWMVARARPQTELAAIAGKRPVVVMYFENQSRSSEVQWLSEGLADMLIANLSRSPNLNVLGRQQLALSLAQSGYSGVLDLNRAMEIGRRTRASEMVLGSFVHVGDQVRIVAQIVNVPDGRTIASENVTASQPAQILNQMDTLSLELAADLGAPVGRRARNIGLASLMTNNLEAYRDYSLGLEMANGLHINEAVGMFQKAIALDPNFAMAQARIGYTLAVTGNRFAEGRPYLERAFARSKSLTQSDRLRIAAWYAVAKLDYPEAIRQYREILSADPSDVEAYGRLGRLLRGEERRDEAIEVLKQGLTWDPSSTDLLNFLGQIYSQLGRHDDAIAMEQKYVSLAPLEANAHDSLALAYHWAGRHDEAEREYRRAIELRPDFGVAIRHLGTLDLHTGRYREGIGQMERALASQRSEYDISLAHDFLGMAYALMGNWKGAIKEAPINPRSFFAALLSIHNGDLGNAVSVIDHITKAEVGNRGERIAAQRMNGFLKGQIALAENRPQEAIADFQEALRHWVHWSDPIWLEDCLADTYLKLGRYDEAIAEYQRALRLFPGMGLTRFHLAEAFRRRGDGKQAAAEYRRFLELWSRADSDVPEVVAARAALAN